MAEQEAAEEPQEVEEPEEEPKEEPKEDEPKEEPEAEAEAEAEAEPEAEAEVEAEADAEPEEPKEEEKEEPKKKAGKKKKKKSANADANGGGGSEDAMNLWKKISNKKGSDMNWYIMKLKSKPGKNADLMAVKEGTGGAAEVQEFLKDQKDGIFFGLLKCVTTDDSKSVRAKFIYLRHIGTGVKTMTKAKLTGFLGKIDDSFPCKHLTIDLNEKCEGDLEPTKLAKELLRVGGAHKPDKMTFGPNQEVLMKDL